MKGMFLALRDIAYARGRFTLMTGVVGLITLLLVMLSGLTGGLGKQNTSALEALQPQAVAFSSDEPSFTESQFSTDDLAQAKDAGAEVTPLGVGQTRLSYGPDSAVGVGIFGLPAGTQIPGTDTTVPENAVVLPQDVANEVGVGRQATVTVGGQDLRVSAIVPTVHYSHSPVVWASSKTWRAVTHAPDGTAGTVLLAASPDNPGLANDTVVSLPESFAGLASYSSERGSLLTMQGFLYAISALVTIAFLTVWTIQRTRDLSILRALGASGSYLHKDALGQAAVVVGCGALAGGLVGLGLGAAASQVLPFELSVITVAVPPLGIFVLGLLGALLATRKVSRTDPMIALGGNA